MAEDLNGPAALGRAEKAARFGVHVLALILVAVGTALTTLGVFCLLAMTMGDDPIASDMGEFLAPTFLVFGIVSLGGGILLVQALRQTAPRNANREA